MNECMRANIVKFQQQANDKGEDDPEAAEYNVPTFGRTTGRRALWANDLAGRCRLQCSARIITPVCLLNSPLSTPSEKRRIHSVHITGCTPRVLAAAASGRVKLFAMLH